MITKERPPGSDIWDDGHTTHLYGKVSENFVRKAIRPTKEDIEEYIESHRRMQEFHESCGRSRIYKLPDGTICAEYEDLIIPDCSGDND